MKYRACLFDFDGTVADTGEGIRRSVAYSLERMGYKVPPVETLNRFIGPPLYDSYMGIFNMTEEQAEHAIQVYRERYVKIGLYESHLYPGITELLHSLHDAGVFVALASAKPQVMVETLTRYFHIDALLDNIVGTGLNRHGADKRDLLLAALPSDVDPRDALMVGDRHFDIEAAKFLGICAIGADYGYAEPGELKAAGADYVFDTVEDIKRWMIDNA